MKFTKMHGLGNDYVYVDCTKNNLANADSIARFVSDRHFGVGSDGLILIKQSDVADFEMEMYNLDGSIGEMCGNGIRCVAKYVYDRGLTDKEVVTVNTGAGIKTLKLNIKDGKVDTVRVDMGAPTTKSALIPVTYPLDEMINEPLEVDGNIYHVTCVSMGNPHCVIFTDADVRKMDLSVIGPKFENHSIFPKRTNVEFVNVLGRDHLRMRVWERGSGETLACGTGACGVAVAAVINNLCDEKINIDLRGGRLAIEYDRSKETVFMTGPATFVFDGEIIIPDNIDEFEDVKIY